MFHAGDSIGPYQLVRQLGRGNFGEVWLAERRSSILAAQVALKLPLDGQADVETIRRQAQSWHQASGHPNVVPFLEADLHDGQIVIASEYISGGSLADWLSGHGGRASSVESALGMIRGVLTGLGYLHRHQVIHRDLKPENVMLQDGLPRLTDFGLSRVLKSGVQSGNVVGTPGYMAPECFQGESGIASDIWSAGVILHELLCGALPYPQRELYALMLAVISSETPAPVSPDIPEALRPVLVKALAREPAERYGSALEMSEALELASRRLQVLERESDMTEDRSARIAHVLFLDIVGYSKEKTSVQSRRIESLNSVVNAAPAFAAAKTADSVRPLPTGDGMVLVFFNDVLAPVRAAVEISHAVKAIQLALRMGIHSGLVLPQMDAVGRDNLVGEGLNTAQRVMDFADAGHILLSAQYAAWLQHFDQWTPFIHPLGDGAAKHNQIISLYSLYSDEFGLSSTPSKLDGRVSKAEVISVQAITGGKNIVLLYKPNVQPDGKVLNTLEDRLRGLGHDVFVDSQLKISAAWARAIEEPIRQSDAVVAIVSPQSLRSEMLEYELETAHDQFLHTGRPILLPVRVGSDDALEGTVASILKPLHFFTWSGPEDDERLVAELLSAITEPLKQGVDELKLEPVGGAVATDSPFYVRRECDAEFALALDAQESILLVKGARQIGKTSLLAQGTKRSRDTGRRVVLTDFQKFNTTQMTSDETFYRLLAATLSRQIKFPYDFANNWDEIFGANLNMENFLRDLIDYSTEPLVWYMDEVDKLFTAPFASDFFGLVRSWHNSRSTEPDGPWVKLTIVIAYATEAHLFIQDLNQSPFNVGRRLNLEDFNIQQVIDLNARYGGPLTNYAATESMYALIGGQPFLNRCALDALAKNQETLSSLIERAEADDGPFSDHLKRILISVSRLPEVSDYVRSMLAGTAQPHQDAYYRLLSAGIVKQNSNGAVVFRCELYRQYLQRHFVS